MRTCCAEMQKVSENRGKSKWTEKLAPSKKTQGWRKAIFAVREVFQKHVYQTRGMACAVDFGGSIRLITWRGVADCNNVVMDRYSEKFSTDVQRYRLQKSTVKTYGSFSFLSVSSKQKFPILRSKVPGNEIKVSNLKAYSFSGEKTIEVEFKYNKSKKEHELITTGGEWEKRVTEKTSLLGSPIIEIIDDDRAVVVGVVGESDGKIVPFFITEKEFDHEKNATEEEEEEEEKDALSIPKSGGAAASNLDHQRDQIESAKSTSSQNEMSSSGKDLPDAKFDLPGQMFANLQKMKCIVNEVMSNTDLLVELDKIASDKGFVISNNEGSGNCMFYAVSEQLNLVIGCKISHKELRQSVVQYLRKNPKLPGGTDLFNFIYGYQSWADYLSSMEKDGTWGDHMILYGIANCYNTYIEVISSQSNCYDVTIRPNGHVIDTNPLMLGYVNKDHYVSLQPKQDHQRDQIESAKSTSSQNEMSSSGKDVPSVRRGAIPIQYLPYLALDIQSSNVGWTSLGRALGVDGAYLSGVSKDHDEDYERCYKMLKRWHQQSGSATYDELAKALKEVYLCDIATKYCYEENDPPTKESQKISGLKAGRVSKRELLGIGRAVEGRRKRLGRALGVPDDEIDKIVEQNRLDVSEQSYQILQKWVQMKGNEATYGALAQALLDRSVMMKAVMEKYCLDPEKEQK